MSGQTYAADWFDSELTFRQLCGDANSQAYSGRAQDFAADMVKAAKQLGLETVLSVKQLEYLCKLADWDVPARLKR